MSISYSDVFGHGALSLEHQDTLHVHWTLIASCNYACTYCAQPRADADCVFVKDRVLSMAHKLLEPPRPQYVFTLTGGEPTLHPHLPELMAYLFASGRKVAVRLETNGSRDVSWYQQLMRRVPEHALELRLSVHLAYADLGQVLTLTAAVAEARQLAHVRLVFDPAQREAAQRFHEALVRLRAVVPFTMQVDPSMAPAEADLPWLQEAEAAFAAAVSVGPAAGPALPFAVPHFAAQQAGAVLALDHEAVRPNTAFKDFRCCLGANLVRVDADGRFYGAMCNMVPNNPPLWSTGDHAVADMVTVARCRNEHCPGGLNAVLPKFRTEDAARAHLAGMKERALRCAWESAPLVDPINAEPRVEDVIRARLKRMPLLRETVTRIDPATTAVITFGDVLEEAIAHYASQQPALPRMPEFVLADWDGAPHEAWENMARQHGVSITPMPQRDGLQQKRFCLYGKKDPVLWGTGCLRPLAEYCATHGLTKGLMVDAVSTSVLTWKRAANVSFVVDRMEDVCTVYKALADDASKEIFLRALKCIMTGDPGYLSVSAYAQYCHPEVKAEPGEIVIEGGLDLGHTTRAFAQQVGEHGRVIGFEPLHKSYENSKKTTSACANVHVEHLGLWSGAQTFYIEDKGGASRMVSTPNANTEECHSIDLDSYVLKKNTRCSLIKLDIEGAEMECLQGAYKTIRRDMPKLQISLYHTFEHYLDVALWLLEHFPEYTLYMGHHTAWYGETCLYALPPTPTVRRRAPLPASVPAPLVSLIVPVHNNEDTLKRCIDSALIQGVRDMEIIIIDDASTDSTPEIIAEYVRRFPKMVRTMRFAENRGPGPARNAGMDMAMGTYMAFIDSDDMLSEQFLTRGLEVMESTQADIVAFDMVLHHHSRKEAELWGVEPGVWAGEASLRQMLLKKAGCYGTYCRLYRSAMLFDNNVRYGHTRVHQDMFFSVQAFFYSQKTVVVPDVGYYRYVRKGSNSASVQGDRYFNSFVDFISFLTRFFENHGLSLEDEMYTYCIRRVYFWDRDRVFAAVTQAEKAQRLGELLTEERLLALGQSKEALCCILADYATLHCHRNNLHPKVAPEDLDWRAAAAAPRPPKTYTAYGSAENPTTPAPLLSVIVPNYNKEKYLKQCLDSIFTQSMQDFEVIIDDASTDNSYDILTDYADTYSSVRLFRMEYNVRQGVCRNIGLEKARGKYVVFVDSDDICLPEYFSVAIDSMLETNADIVLFSTQVVNEAGEVQWSNSLSNLAYTGREAVLAYLQGIFQPAPWGKIFKTNLLRQNKCLFPDYVYHQDQAFFGKALFAAKHIISNDITVYVNVMSEDSTLRPSTKKYLHLHSAFCFFYEFQKLSEKVLAKGNIFNIIGTRHTLWNIENVFLPACYAFQLATGSTPIDEGDWSRLKSCTLFLWSLLLGVSRAGTTHAKDLLPAPSGRVSSKYVPSLQGKPLISVIIPTYNQEACISRCLDSVLGQSLHNFEVIVVNDASTDKTLELCEAYAKKDPRVRVYSNEMNRGVGYSRNFALKVSRGEYITYVDSDDTILADFFVRALAGLCYDSSIDIVHFSYHKITESHDILEAISCTPQVMDGKTAALKYIRGEHAAWTVWSKVYRASLLKNNRIQFPHIMHEDEVFLIEAFFFSKKVLFIDEIAYMYVQVTHSASAMNPIKITPTHINGYFACSALREQIISKLLPDAERAILLKNKANMINKGWRRYSPYLASLFSRGISPLTDKNVFDIKKAPEMFKVLISGYASCYVESSNLLPCVAMADTDPLDASVPPANDLIPVGAHNTHGDAVALSVIIPAFNVASCLPRCLESVIEQRVDDIEIILVEDCSTNDATLEVCREYAARHACIRLFRTPWNSGLGTVRNLALQQARGTYVTFVDSDDWMAPGFLQRGLALMERSPDCELIDFSWCAWDDVANKELYYRRMPDGMALSGLDALKCYVEGTYSTYGAVAKIFKRVFLCEKNICFSPYYNEDESFLLKLYASVTKMQFSDILAYYYVRNADTPSIMRPTVRGKKYFESTVYNLQQAHAFLSAILPEGEASPVYKRRMEAFLRGHHRDNLLLYIYACKQQGLPSPLTDEVMDILCLSKEFIRALIMDYAVLSQKALPAGKE